MIWYKRQTFRDLLNSIDIEPKMGEEIDKNQRQREKNKSTKRTVQLTIFLLLFTLLTASDIEMDYGNTVFGIYFDMFLLIILGVDILLFALVITLYITFSWIFRIKVEKTINFLKNDLKEGVKNGRNPELKSAKLIEIWFKSYLIQLKKYDQLFKRISGSITFIMIYSVLSHSANFLKGVINNDWSDSRYSFKYESLIDMVSQLTVLFYTLSSLSSVDFSLQRLIKILYQLSLSIKFNITSNDKQSDKLSQKVRQKSNQM